MRSGNSSRIASAKTRASSRSGVDVSHQSRSASGAYASPRAMAASMPSRTRKNPSAVRSPVRKRRSRSSTSDVSSAAESASVRAISTVGVSATSAASRAAVSVRSNCSVGTSTLPPRWPHFFSDASWSSKCTPAAPASIIEPISSNAFSVPAEPGFRVGDDRREPVPVQRAGRPGDLVRPAQRVVDPPDDGGDGVDRIQRLIGIRLAGQVRVRRHLPPER